MNKYNSPYLQKYAPGTKQECPSCGVAKKFTLYLDGNTHQVIHPKVGRCDRESSCGYHYTPKQFFIDNPSERSEPIRTPFAPKPTTEAPKKFDTIPFEYVEKYATCDNNFLRFLCELFSYPIIEELLTLYKIGSTTNKEVIFWQIDQQGRFRDGKVMQYDLKTGRRGGAIYLIHTKVKAGFASKQCLFGEHLLNFYPKKSVALVESEKTAMICTAVYPDHVWLATGGKYGFSIDKLQVLKNRKTIIFPDADGYEVWEKRAEELKRLGFSVSVYQGLKDEEDGIDIADLIVDDLREKEHERTHKPLTKQESFLKEFKAINPALQTLISQLNLELCEVG